MAKSVQTTKCPIDQKDMTWNPLQGWYECPSCVFKWVWSSKHNRLVFAPNSAEASQKSMDDKIKASKGTSIIIGFCTYCNNAVYSDEPKVLFEYSIAHDSCCKGEDTYIHDGNCDCAICLQALTDLLQEGDKA